MGSSLYWDLKNIRTDAHESLRVLTGERICTDIVGCRIRVFCSSTELIFRCMMSVYILSSGCGSVLHYSAVKTQFDSRL